ncbi:MAG: hypothetical protein EOP50_00185 [Sphingobacteriales bacterium]|nr:MAG: hypothetical protein EOP50_00185 [Sphingobacteriales bacterium]
MKDIKQWLAGPRPYDAGVALYQAHGKDPLLLKAFSEPHTEFKERRLAQALEGLLISPDPRPVRVAQRFAILGSEIIRSAEHYPKPNIKYEPADAWQHLIDQLPVMKAEMHADGFNLNAREDDGRVDDVEYTVSDLQEQVEGLTGTVKKLQEHAKAKHRNGWPIELDATLQALHDQWKPLFTERMMLMNTIYDVAKAGRTDTEKRLEAGRMAHRILALREQCIALYEQRDHYLEHGKLPADPVPEGVATDPRQFPKKLANHERYRREYKAKLEALQQAAAPDQAAIGKLQANIQKQDTYISWYKKQMGDGTL